MSHIFSLLSAARLSAASLLFPALLAPEPLVAQSPSTTPNSAQVTQPAAPSATRSQVLADAQRLINRGHASDALQELDAVATTDPTLPGLDRTRGLALYTLNRLPEADQAFAKALIADPNDLECAQMRGLVLYRLGRPADAIPLLERAPGWGPQTKADPSYVLALCYMDTRRYDDARHAFAAQYGFPPDSAPAYLLTARMLLRREYLPIAQTFATHALELDPQIPLAHGLLGEIALAGNHLEDAISELDKERLRNPLEGSTYERLGDAYSRAGRYNDAEKVLQQAVLLEPHSTGPYILLGKVILKQGDAVGAMTYLQKAQTMDPANYMTHNLLAQAYRALGRDAEAKQEIELTEKLQSANAPQLSSPQ
jgi:predicted Zn-dependent protease